MFLLNLRQLHITSVRIYFYTSRMEEKSLLFVLFFNLTCKKTVIQYISILVLSFSVFCTRRLDFLNISSAKELLISA